MAVTQLSQKQDNIKSPLSGRLDCYPARLQSRKRAAIKWLWKPD